jgi:hypothetical protein
VLVLDALSDKPQSGVEVHNFCAGKSGNELPPKRALTNSEGFAEIPYRCDNEKRVELYVIAPHPKEQCGSIEPLTLEAISVGVMSNPMADGNIWCPPKVSRKLKSTPGQIVIFVKKPTWWQSHIAG